MRAGVRCVGFCLRGYWVVKLISKFAVGLLLAGLPLFAQIHGVPASVTSHGAGRGPAPGVPASVTSVGRGIQGGRVTPVRPSVTSLGPNGFSNTCTNSGLVPSALGCTNPAFTPTVNFHTGQVQFGQQFDTRGSRSPQDLRLRSLCVSLLRLRQRIRPELRSEPAAAGSAMSSNRRIRTG